jgi:hypothetical protein
MVLVVYVGWMWDERRYVVCESKGVGVVGKKTSQDNGRRKVDETNKG